MTRHDIAWIASLLLGVVATSLGCGNSSSRGAVRGSVTLDGMPLDDATITFAPEAAGQDKAAWTMTKQGKYSIPAVTGPAVGPSRVEIRASRKTGKQLADTGPFGAADEMREIVPPRYNSQSELNANIKSGDNIVDFDLKSK